MNNSTIQKEKRWVTAYFLFGFEVISALQIAAIAQPAMGQCVEPTQEPTISVVFPIETIIADNSYRHLGNDIKEDLTPKEPEGVTYTKTFFLDSGFESPKLGLTAKNLRIYSKITVFHYPLMLLLFPREEKTYGRYPIPQIHKSLSSAKKEGN